MSWTVRHMDSADIDSVLRLSETIPEAPHWSRSEYELCCLSASASSPLRVGFVAETTERILGFSTGKLVAGVCELEAIAVSKEARGQGIGFALLRAFTEWGQAHQAIRLELEVRASNHAAIKLYERSGLQHEGLRKSYYSMPEEDAVLMGATLPLSGKNA